MSWFCGFHYLIHQHQYGTAVMSMIPTVSYAHRITTAVFGITIRYETYVLELNFIALPVGRSRNWVVGHPLQMPRR